MIVTELEGSSDGSADSNHIATDYTVKEFSITNDEEENEEHLDDNLRKMYDYYVSEVIEDMEKESVDKSNTDPTEEQIRADSCEVLGKEFKNESFTKTFKTLVDIVVEPQNDCCLSPSSSDSEASEDVISIIPTISSLSTNFITQTTNIFSSKSTEDIQNSG
ncbi:hypothetical protein BEWA_004890 [Theileria equi strain WA]|uniref:Uncharacterized protein n=1 Tax=Theileria equi strain WA TaxID=1537102 RepID=L0B1F5_THEEQ|nr:hypothetical protein BEWA_004890 [Theileria equi strain WA]AFZ81081.1 hypothetical protein BEWA_004890 [Theileria equi strain WA]|eukprot:XP_004830747.1 hypothetical protein BEWA_004890 [Theileria equi strain WA]